MLSASKLIRLTRTCIRLSGMEHDHALAAVEARLSGFERPACARVAPLALRRDHTSYPKPAPSRARMNSAPTSTQESSGGNRRETARTMNTSGSVTPLGLV